MMSQQTEDLQKDFLSKAEGVAMPMQPCLLVRLADGELARQSLINLRILDQHYTPHGLEMNLHCRFTKKQVSINLNLISP